MNLILLLLAGIVLCSCANVKQGPYTRNNMAEDSIDWGYNKYNMLDTPDGSNDPNAKIKIWGAKY